MTMANRPAGMDLGSYPALTQVKQPGGNTVPPSQGSSDTRSPGAGTGVVMAGLPLIGR